MPLTDVLTFRSPGHYVPGRRGISKLCMRTDPTPSRAQTRSPSHTVRLLGGRLKAPYAAASNSRRESGDNVRSGSTAPEIPSTHTRSSARAIYRPFPRKARPLGGGGPALRAMASQRINLSAPKRPPLQASPPATAPGNHPKSFVKSHFISFHLNFISWLVRLITSMMPRRACASLSVIKDTA